MVSRVPIIIIPHNQLQIQNFFEDDYRTSWEDSATKPPFGVTLAVAVNKNEHIRYTKVITTRTEKQQH